MSHMLARNPFVDSFGLEYDSPFSRNVNFNRGIHNHSPMPRRNNENSYLPRWLKFKSTKTGSQQSPTPEVHDSANIPSQETREDTNTRKDSHGKFLSRQLRTASVSKGLRCKVEEHEMKTRTEEWKKIRKYEKIRERRKLKTKQMNRKLRFVRRFYMPTAICVVIGIFFIFCSTIQSLGNGTMFWNHKEQFKIIGTVVTLLGILLLFVTVAFESQISQQMKKENIFDIDPFIHPDFLNEPCRIARQISLQSSTCSSS